MKPISEEEVILELRRCKGNQFDAEIVESFVSLLTSTPNVNIDNL